MSQKDGILFKKNEDGRKEREETTSKINASHSLFSKILDKRELLDDVTNKG